jgi:2,5-diketo-D-gluconate reductase A
MLAAPIITLSDGYTIPSLGFGSYRIPAGNTTYAAIRSAISLGCRHIDTAQIYGNEVDVGDAIRDSGVPRSDIFVTTKLSAVWLSNHVTYDRTLANLRASLNKLKFDYVDLYLIHSPRDVAHRAQQWRALVDARAAGLVRSIGVSDYQVAQLAELEPPPAVLQIEVSPWLAATRAPELEFCRARGIKVEAWGVLGAGSNLDDPTLAAVAARHGPGTTTADVLLAWNKQVGSDIQLVTSTNPRHQAANLALVAGSFELSGADLAELAALSATPVFSGRDAGEDKGFVVVISLIITTLLDSALFVFEPLGVEATQLMLLTELGLALWAVALILLGVWGCVRCGCCGCCPESGGGARSGGAREVKMLL